MKSEYIALILKNSLAALICVFVYPLFHQVNSTAYFVFIFCILFLFDYAVLRIANQSEHYD